MDFEGAPIKKDPKLMEEIEKAWAERAEEKRHEAEEKPESNQWGGQNG